MRIPPGLRVFLVADPVDLRASFYRLASHVRGTLGMDPQTLGHLYVFLGKRGSLVKIPDCKEERAVIGRETSWRLEYTTKSEVVVTHRLTRACHSHHGGPLTPAAPPKPVDKGHLGFDLAARAIVLRFGHNLPIHRLVEMFNDEGLPISEEILHTLFDTTSERVNPVIEALVARVRAAALLNLDDTPVLIVDQKQATRRRGRIWLALGDGRWAWFFSTQTWKESEAEARLGKITGTLQGDGYTGFKKLAKKNGIALAGCMAHLRRKLRKAMLAHDPRATEAMALLHALYRVEELAKLQGLDADGVLALRKERSVPMMNALERWAREVAPTIESGSPLGQAWTYLDNPLPHLRQFLLDGRVSIDNNAAERGLRRITTA
jgi:transposase